MSIAALGKAVKPGLAHDLAAGGQEKKPGHRARAFQTMERIRGRAPAIRSWA